MTQKIFFTHQQILKAAAECADRIGYHFLDRPIGAVLQAYPIPRGGVPAAYAVQRYLPTMRITGYPNKADFFIDDLVDSGATAARYAERYGRPVFALFEKPAEEPRPWYVFPWEHADTDNEASVTDNITRLLQYIGEDANRGGLVETPARYIKALAGMTAGYKQKPEDVLKCFTDGGEKCDEMVIVKDIPFYSLCEHHLAPFFGTATIAYIPDGKIVGLSKLSRLLDVFARRLQVQERLTNQVVDALEQHLQPKGAGIVVKARHLCMESRGVCKQGHHTITSALRGALRELPAARAEFMELAK